MKFLPGNQRGPTDSMEHSRRLQRRAVWKAGITQNRRISPDFIRYPMKGIYVEDMGIPMRG
jgi:hypothetical protein